MTDTNSRLSKPGNKSFDKNIQLCVGVPKICFNPCCNNKSENWITIIGRFAGYRDYEVPYCVCDKCNSFLDFRPQALNHLVNTLQDVGKVQRIGVDIGAHNPPSGKMTVTTKDLNNLTFETSAYDMMESEAEINQNDHKVCYNLHCNNEGTHWIDIINATTLLADHEISYCICDRCYAFFNYRRKDPLIFTRPKKLLNALEILNGKEEEEEIEKVFGINPFTGREAITTKDLYNLLESTNRERG